MKWHIQQARCLDPMTQSDSTTDIFISEGQIIALGKAPDGFTADKTLDASGLWALPGFVDLSARLPGGLSAKALPQEVYAARKAGFSQICCQPDTALCLDTPSALQQWHKHANSDKSIQLHPLGALTEGLRGEQLSDLSALVQAGAVAITQAQQTDVSTLVLRQCYDYAHTHHIPVVLRAEDSALYKGTVAHEGKVSTFLGLPSSPAAAETAALSMQLSLVEQTGITAHFACLSSAGSVALIKEAKAKGLPVSASVALHHLILDEEALLSFNPHAHLRPPLRSAEDRQALLAGLESGVIDAICSDHHPHTAEAKLAPFGDTQPGLSALDTFPALLFSLVSEKRSPLLLLSAASMQAAQCLGLSFDTLQLGASANFMLYDPEASWEVSETTLLSAGKNTPFLGRTLSGRICHRFYAGNLVE